MKKTTIMLFLLLLGVAFNGYAQASPPSDFFAGDWKSLIENPGVRGGPEGIILIYIIRKDGKLNVTIRMEWYKYPTPPNFLSSTVKEERATELDIRNDIDFGDIRKYRDEPMTLTKGDGDTLKVSFLGMELTAIRAK